MFSAKVFSTDRNKLPNFIIGGGMKCGTSTLHWLLNQHENVFIPGSADEEPHFFTIDDIEQNPDFFLQTKESWPCWDYEAELETYLEWYLRFFADAKPNQIIGEDCVSYLSSKKAPKRIKELLPDVKLIFVLRDPVERTYSQYWHWVKTNRAIYNFEKTIQFAPSHLLSRSLYYEHISRFLTYFPRSQIKFIIFEDFIDNMQKTIDDICRFLNLTKSIDVSLHAKHINKAIVPNSITLQLLFNRLFKTKYSGRKYQCYHLPRAKPSNYPSFPPRFLKLFQSINLTPNKTYPPMKSETRRFLENFFYKENRGLTELINKKIDEFWPYFK